jgi:DNA replicative helicase MCM subunit Mcm2 (Cdc46/Mcm family)
MPEQAYHISAREAQVILKMAMAEAKALLPPAVTKQHWTVGHLPVAWRLVESWYRSIATQKPDVLVTLTDLALMSEALACLASVTAAGSP